MKIGKHDISKSVLVVAEIGANHEGDVDVARMMVEKAAEAGVDAVKFQTYNTSLFLTSEDPDRFAAVEGRSLTYDEFGSLAELSESLGVTFLSTPLDLESLDFLDAFVPAFKIASGDLNYTSLLEKTAGKGKPVILSTGMSTLDEITDSLEILRQNGLSDLESSVVLLHCVTLYPTLIEHANLLSIPFLRDEFGLQVGYSDHTLGISACLAAVALGARVIEKHFTYSRDNQEFRDHYIAVEPHEMAEMIEQIREIETALGTVGKVMAPGEEEFRTVARRSLALNKRLGSGDTIEAEDVIAIRPATGLSLDNTDSVIGRKMRQAKGAGLVLTSEDLA